MIIHEIKADLARQGCREIIHLSQGDANSHRICFQITKNQKRWTPPAGLGVLIHYSNSYGSGGSYDTLPDGSPAWEIRQRQLLVTLVPETMALPGSVQVTVTLLLGGEALSAFHVQLMVQAMATATSPVLANYSRITGFLPCPDTAQEGQFFAAESVTDEGRVLTVKASDVPTGGGDGGGSPTARVTETSDGARITISDKNGTTTATIKNGIDGRNGADGKNGSDGKSAYQYAKEGGYTGTEAEFSAMLASEGYGYVAQPEPPADTNLLWLDTDDESADASGAQADWNAPEGEPGHVLNRTHYDYIAKVVEEITINASSQETTFTAASPIVIGETYSIHWGDEIYVCEAVDGSVMAPEGAGYPVLGNYGNLIGGTDTGEPFVIMVMGTNGMVIGFGEDIEITFSIDGKTTKKISEKYLPAFVKSCVVPVNSLEDKITKITLDTTELAEAIKNNYPIYIEKVSGYIAARYTVNRVALDILADAGITTLTQAIDWLVAMGFSVSNLPVRLYFSDGWGDNSYSVYININE